MNDRQTLLIAVCAAASDYVLGRKEPEFAEGAGGLDDLYGSLELAVEAMWEDEKNGATA